MDTRTTLLVLAGFVFSGFFGVTIGLLLQTHGHFRRMSPMARVMDASRATPADTLVNVRAAQLRSRRRVAESTSVATRAFRSMTTLVRGPTATQELPVCGDETQH